MNTTYLGLWLAGRIYIDFTEFAEPPPKKEEKKLRLNLKGLCKEAKVDTDFILLGFEVLDQGGWGVPKRINSHWSQTIFISNIYPFFRVK